MSQSNLDQPLSPSDDQVASFDGDRDSVAESAVYGLPVATGESAGAIDSESEESAVIPTQSESDYLDDDEHWAAASDEILHSSEDSVIVQQEEAVVSWDIQGLYDEQGKVRGKRSLKNNPPMLVISDSSGESATFILTKDLSAVLARHFDNTHRAYYGIRPKDELTLKEKLADAKSGLRNNLGKTIVIGGIFLALLIFGLVF